MENEGNKFKTHIIKEFNNSKERKMFEEVLGGNELKELKNRFSASAGQCEGITVRARLIKTEQEDGLFHTHPGGSENK